MSTLADLRAKGEALGCDMVFDSGRRRYGEVGFAFLDKLELALAMEEAGDIDGMKKAIGEAKEMAGIK